MAKDDYPVILYQVLAYLYNCLTDGVIYNVVKDKYGALKVVDDSEEDYLYDFKNPRPADNSSIGGTFIIVDDPQEELKKLYKI